MLKAIPAHLYIIVSLSAQMYTVAYTSSSRCRPMHSRALRQSPMMTANNGTCPQISRCTLRLSRDPERLRGLKDLSYTERLLRLNIPSLELRRLQLYLIFCYKIVFGRICTNVDDFFTFSPSPQSSDQGTLIQTV